jgi:DNA-directed RNA polymerase III subunit RPC4
MIVSSKYSKDSIMKKPIPKKDARGKTLVSAQSLFEPKTQQNKPKKERKDEGLDMKTAINKLKEKDPTMYFPTTLPFVHPEEDAEDYYTAKEIMNENGSLKENDILFFQFPRLLPVDLDIQKKLLNDEIDPAESEYDPNGFLIKNEFENMFKSIPNNTKIGKLKIFKSGKVKLQIGENLYDISAGINCKFAQEYAVVSQDTHEAIFLGKAQDKKLVVTPKISLN